MRERIINIDHPTWRTIWPKDAGSRLIANIFVRIPITYYIYFIKHDYIKSEILNKKTNLKM